jgi:hypothetical protein
MDHSLEWSIVAISLLLMLSVLKLKIDIISVIQQEPAIINGKNSKAYPVFKYKV